MSYSDAVIDVVGVGTDGVDGLSAALRAIVLDAELVVAAPRLLETLPVTTGQERRPWPSPLLPALPRLLQDCDGRRTVVLASGDPLVSGVGSTLIRALGAAGVRVHPAVSSVTLARARMGWPAESHETISLVSAPVAVLHRWLTPGARLVLLSAGAHTPGEVAALLTAAGWGHARLTVLGLLGDPQETRLDTTAAAYRGQVPALNIVAVDLGRLGTVDRRAVFSLGWSPGLPDEAFEHDGQLTKWELRIAALARLRPLPGQLLWDLGAGCGSVSVEWARTHPSCRSVAVERDRRRAAVIGRNAAALGVPRTVDVRHGQSDDVLSGLPDPDAVFLGGGATAALVEAVWQRLPHGGRIVAHAVTLDTERVLVDAQSRHGGHLRRLAVDRAEPLGTLTSWTPARPVVQWAAAKLDRPETEEDR